MLGYNSWGRVEICIKPFFLHSWSTRQRWPSVVAQPCRREEREKILFRILPSKARKIRRGTMKPCNSGCCTAEQVQVCLQSQTEIRHLNLGRLLLSHSVYLVQLLEILSEFKHPGRGYQPVVQSLPPTANAPEVPCRMHTQAQLWGTNCATSWSHKQTRAHRKPGKSSYHCLPWSTDLNSSSYWCLNLHWGHRP